MKLRLVDKIVGYEEGASIKTKKAISFEEFSLLKRWGRKGVFPETLLLQLVVESASLLIARSTGFESIGLLTEVKDVHFAHETVPGDVLLAKAHIQEIGHKRWCIRFTIQTGDKEIADGEVTLAASPLQVYSSVRDYGIMWEELHDRAS